MDAADPQSPTVATRDPHLPSSEQLLGLSSDHTRGNPWRGSLYSAASRSFSKWWPTTYAGQWRLPNGMSYPYLWTFHGISMQDGRAREEWSWNWVETPGLPTIAQVEEMLLQEYLRTHAAQAAADPTATPQDEEPPETASASTGVARSPLGVLLPDSVFPPPRSLPSGTAPGPAFTGPELPVD